MKSFQFSLRSLMAATSLTAVSAGLWAARPTWQCALIQIPVFVAVPTAIAVLAARTTDYWRTFYLATLAVMLMTATLQVEYLYALAPYLYDQLAVRENLSGFAQTKVSTLGLWPVAFFAGATAALTHRLLTPARATLHSKPTHEATP